MNARDVVFVGLRAWRHLSRQRKIQFTLLVFLMVFASFVEVFSIGAVVPFLAALSSPDEAFKSDLLQPLILAIGISQPKDLILPVTVIFCTGAIASGCLRYLLLVAQTRITYATGVDFSVGIFERILYQPYLVHISRNSSEVIAGVTNKANDLIVSLLYPMAMMLNAVILLSIVLTALIAVEPLVTLATIFIFSIFYGLMLLLSRELLEKSSRIIAKQYSNVIRLIQEGLGGIRDILLDGTQYAFVNTYRVAETRLRNSRAMVQITSGTPRYAIETIGTLIIALMAYYMSADTQGLVGAVPVLGVVALAAQRLIPVIQQLYSSWVSIAGGYVSVTDALDLLEQPIQMPTSETKKGSLPFLSNIKLTNVDFRYGDNSPLVLQDFNLTIFKGQRLGVIGETGSGKSTFLDLVMGLITPTRGQLLIDEITIDASNQHMWQQHIAHVPQTIFLTDSTMTENIAFGKSKEEIDVERVKAAAKTAQIYDVIMGLSKGFNTLVGERGVRLSGGQLQRIGIARALYRQADVIIFDEATSALDTDTERAVMDAIHNLPKKVTLFVVAHRHSTLSECSSVIRIANGRAELVNDFFELLKE